VQQESSFVM
nr:Chain C, Peptide antigen [synthetic construct]